MTNIPGVVTRLLILLFVLCGLIAAAFFVSRREAPPLPESIAKTQGLEVTGQAGKPGFPVDRVAASHERITDRAPRLLGRSTVMALVDEVPFSAKSHVTVRYGASIFEPRAGPIEIASTYLLPYHETIVLGAEAITANVVSGAFLVQFGRQTETPAFAIIIKRHGASPVAFSHMLSEDILKATARASILALSQADPMLDDAAAQALTVRPMATVPEGSGRLFRAELDARDDAAVEAVYLIISSPEKKPIVLDYVGFTREGAPEEIVVLETNGGNPEALAVLLVKEETGLEQHVYPNAAGDYAFRRPKDRLFSVTFRSADQVNHLPAGRWLSPDQHLHKTRVTLSPEYVNRGGEMTSLEAWQKSIKRSRIQSSYTDYYAPHTRSWWGGLANRVALFRSEFFYNNIGFHDIDVIPQSSDRCLVGIYLGESIAEARQVRLFERSTIVLGEELSIRLGKCVLVYTLAAGKSIQSYEDILRARADFAPHFVLSEIYPSMLMYMTPIFQQHYFGYARGFSPNAAFDEDARGGLQYFPPTKAWLDKRVEPNQTLSAGTPLATAFILPEEHAPAEANQAWRVLEKLMAQYKREFPDMLFALDAIYERARCAVQDGCINVPSKSAADGSTIPAGTPVFEARLQRLCTRAQITCALAPSSSAASLSRPLIYGNDVHYTRRGHYQHAQLLADRLAETLKAHPAQNARQ